MLDRLKRIRITRKTVAIAIVLAAAAWAGIRYFDTVRAESLAGCWDGAGTNASGMQVRARLCFRTASSGRLTFEFERLLTEVWPDARFLSTCQATGSAQIEEFGDWRGVYYRPIEMSGTSEFPLCQAVYLELPAESIHWEEARDIYPGCKYERADDSIVCDSGGITLRRRQGAPPVGQGDHCAVVRAALATGILPEERAAWWRQLDQAHCSAVPHADAAATPQAPPSPPSPPAPQAPPAALVAREGIPPGCYSHALGTHVETLCFGADSNRAARISLLTTSAHACSASISPRPSTAPWQFEFSLTWHCVIIEHGYRYAEQQLPGTRARYCSVAAEGRLTCSVDPQDPGYVYAR